MRHLWTGLGLSCVALAAACATPSADRAEAAPDDPAKLRRIEEMYREYKAESFPDLPDVSAAELHAMQERGEVVVVDVRPPEERRVSWIPGAISKQDYEATLQGSGESSKAAAEPVVVTYCTVGYRSGVYAAELRRRGVDARNLRGSLLAWTHAGLPLVDAAGPTRRLHVYGARWDLAAADYETVW